MIIEVGDKIVSSEIFSKEFVCDLNVCKGACCVEGDEGAPLTAMETRILDTEYENIKPFLRDVGIKAIEENGAYYHDQFGEAVTQLVNEKECAFVTIDSNGWTKCGIEEAHKAGKTHFKKPISCHLYPIRVKKYETFEALNYDKWDICSCACDLGKELKVSVYKFLKEPLIREYGEEFYKELELVDSELNREKKA